ncbi:MAG: hypothetical protein HZA00_10525 [Nitrospinae bacterium]|nr:hypothetical protein [Nitrospinota bacterium]
MKFAVKENLKIYAYLYLMTAPFTYLVIEIIKNIRLWVSGKRYYAYNTGDEFLFLNIFVALSFWVYIKKIQPLLKDENGSKKK